MAQEFQGGICGGPWWNPPRSLFSSSGGFDMGAYGWPNEVIGKGAKGVNSPNNFGNSLDFPADLDSTLDVWGFTLSPTPSTTTDLSQTNLFCNGGDKEGNFSSIMLESENSNISSSNIMNTNTMCGYNMNNLDASPPMASSGDSSTITSEGGLMNSYLIQTLFEDTDDSQVVQQPMNNPNYGCAMSPCDFMSSPCCSWIKPSSPNIDLPIQSHPTLPLGKSNELDGGMNLLVNGGQNSINGQYSTPTDLSNIRASLLNSLKSRSKAKVNREEVHNSKGSINDQPLTKRPRIETPSPLPTFKVRKEKLGDRITALQQLVSPFGKTDTASVLHEAIEYIKYLHDQVNALSTPYFKNGTPMQHQQEKQEDKQDLKSGRLCVVPISSTYPIVQETSVDFWTPIFEGATFR